MWPGNIFYFGTNLLFGMGWYESISCRDVDKGAEILLSANMQTFGYLPSKYNYIYTLVMMYFRWPLMITGTSPNA